MHFSFADGARRSLGSRPTQPDPSVTSVSVPRATRIA
jgi:hypothetical protein